jgi:hypothetical protein
MPQLFIYCIKGKKKYVASDYIMIQYILIMVTGGTAELVNRRKTDEGVFVCLEKPNVDSRKPRS